MEKQDYLRIRPKKGYGFYLEVYDTQSVCFELAFYPWLPVIRFQLPHLMVEFGIMNRERGDYLDDFFKPVNKK